VMTEPLGKGRNGKDVWIGDIWPSSDEVHALMKYAIDPKAFEANYGKVKADPGDLWKKSSSGTGPLVAGAINIVNMTAWKPVELKLNVQVLNNNKPPLMIRNELASSHRTILNVENIYQQNINGTYILRTRPNSDINIIFYYNADFSSPSHQKIIPYHSTLDSTVTLNYVIDCSTF